MANCFFSLVFSSTLSAEALQAPTSQDYFDSPVEQSFHRQKVITTMKKEVNSYSERLHDLQDRFYRIFYGQEGASSHLAPFSDTSEPLAPILTNENTKGNYIDAVEPKKEGSPRSQLAFEVDAAEGKVPQAKEERFLGSGRGYWILRSGLLIPHSSNKSSSGSNVKYRKYNSGVLTELMVGAKIERIRIGAGVMFRFNSFHSSSYEANPGNHFESGNGSSTFGGCLEVCYYHAISKQFELFARMGLGYGVSVIEDSVSGNSRYDPTFILSPSVGGRWNFSDSLSLDFGYSYVHENEAPAHGLVLGLAGKI